MAKIPIVDSADNIITYKERGHVALSDIYRVSVLWIRHPSHGRILLAQRALTKDHDPGKWEPAVAGTVEQKQTYLDNILQEAREEIGLHLKETDLQRGPKLFLNQGWTFFCQIYIVESTIESEALTIQKDELIQIRWWNKSDIATTLQTRRDMFTRNFDTIWNALEHL